MNSIALLLQMLDQAFDRKSWHGTNLRGALSGLDVPVVSFRPAPERKNIWEIVVHAAYWKYVVRRRLLGEKRGSFPLKGSNWFVRTGESGASWTTDLALLEETHRSLRDAVASLRPDQLPFVPPSSKVTNLDLVLGIAAHDLYHAGQIQTLKKLAESARVSPGFTNVQQV